MHDGKRRHRRQTNLPQTGGDAVEGTLMTFPLDPRDRPQAAKIVQEFKARNIDPEGYTLYAYAAVEIIAQAAEAAHSLDPKAIAKVMLTGMVFNTVLGDIAYDTKGDITPPDYSIFVWKKEADGKMGFVSAEAISRVSRDWRAPEKSAAANRRGSASCRSERRCR